MSLIASNKGREFKPVQPGNYVGRCYQVIDLGTQTTTGKFGEKSEKKIRIGWELFGEDNAGQPLTIAVNGKMMPLTITRQYTASLHKKANMRRDLAAWRGRDFDETESIGFDITAMIDTWGMVNVTHTITAERVYANVAGLSPLPAVLRRSCPAAVHPAQVFDLDHPDSKVFAAFSETLQNKIKSAPEYRATENIDQDTGEITRTPAPAPVNPAPAPAAPQAPALPIMLHVQFQKNLPMWQSLIESGKKTADQIIAMVSTKAELSAQQIAIIQQSGVTA